MVRGQQRLELFLKQVGAQDWGVVVLAGSSQGRPERQRCQWPLATLAQAESALRSTAGALMASGFEARPAEYVVWSVAAQKVLRTLKTSPSVTSSRTPSRPLDPDEFDPLA